MFEEFNHFFQESVDSNGIDIGLLTSSSTINLFKKYRRLGLSFFYYNADTRKQFGELPTEITTSYFNLCKKLLQRADIPYDEYKKYLNVFYTVTGAPKGSTIRECHSIKGNIGPDKKRDSLVKFGEGKLKPYNKNVRLFHTSEKSNITKLKPFFRSQDSDGDVEALFPKPRIYFGYNDICSRMIGKGTKDMTDDQIKKRYFDENDLFVYEYIGPPEYIDRVYTDPELGGVAVYVETDHELPVKRITFEEFKNGIKSKNIQESYGPNDDTSGTSDFDVTDNDEPDDCFCESVRTNGVFLKGGMITKESNIPFKKLYHGTHAPLKTHDGYAIVDGPFFVTPYKSLASIFAVRKNTNESLPSEVPKKMITNISYEEWGSPSDTILNKVHELVMYADDTHFDDIVSMEKGYVYEFDVDDEIRDHIFQSDAMKRGGNREYVIDKLPQLRIISETPIDVELTLRSIKDHNQDRVKRTLMRYGMVQEAYDAITGEEIPIDHAYTMDEMKERTYTDDDLDKIRSKEELNAFYTKLKSKLGQSETIQEAKLPAKKRKELPDSDFALVYTDNRTGKKVRKYPVHDKEHVESAARMFPRGVPLKYQGKVARKILRRAHEFGIDTSGWKNLNKYKERD